MKKMIYFEDLSIGQKIKIGPISVTEKEIIEFAKKYDPQPFHIDAEKAKDSLSIEIDDITSPSDFIRLRAETDSNALKKKFVHEYTSISKKNVFRGFHYQYKKKQGFYLLKIKYF